MDWEQNFSLGKEIILATSSKNNIPNAIIAISLGIEENNLLVADCQMKNTLKNLKENNNIAIIGGYYKIKGTAKLETKGKYFDICQEKTKSMKVKTAIIINIDEVYDLDKTKKII